MSHMLWEKPKQDRRTRDADDLTLDRRIQMLNADQEHIFTQDHLQYQYRHEKELCHCTDFRPLHMFISGVGGTGKSFLIKTIKEQVAAIWATNALDLLTCAVAAPAGLAAQCWWHHYSSFVSVAN